MAGLFIPSTPEDIGAADASAVGTPKGTVFPDTPALGDFFYRTDVKCIYQFVEKEDDTGILVGQWRCMFSSREQDTGSQAYKIYVQEGGTGDGLSEVSPIGDLHKGLNLVPQNYDGRVYVLIDGDFSSVGGIELVAQGSGRIRFIGGFEEFGYYNPPDGLIPHDIVSSSNSRYHLLSSPVELYSSTGFYFASFDSGEICVVYYFDSGGAPTLVTPIDVNNPSSVTIWNPRCRLGSIKIKSSWEVSFQGTETSSGDFTSPAAYFEYNIFNAVSFKGMNNSFGIYNTGASYINFRDINCYSFYSYNSLFNQSEFISCTFNEQQYHGTQMGVLTISGFSSLLLGPNLVFYPFNAGTTSLVIKTGTVNSEDGANTPPVFLNGAIYAVGQGYSPTMTYLFFD